MTNMMKQLEQFSRQAQSYDGILALTTGVDLNRVVLTGIVKLKDNNQVTLRQISLLELGPILQSLFSSPNTTESGELTDRAKEMEFAGNVYDKSANLLFSIDDFLYNVVPVLKLLREVKHAS